MNKYSYLLEETVLDIDKKWDGIVSLKCEQKTCSIETKY
jgi:hypothetical protein